mmetsp:Transcript_91663/g.258289  ORF Transcript_91663/g.258289 Transcript_91663/m.258289 type:complete len:407 (-) Transcript_91663:570-1790(-)
MRHPSSRRNPSSPLTLLDGISCRSLTLSTTEWERTSVWAPLSTSPPSTWRTPRTPRRPSTSSWRLVCTWCLPQASTISTLRCTSSTTTRSCLAWASPLWSRRKVGNIDGARIAGVLLQAGPFKAEVLLQWGDGSHLGDAQNPGFLHDVFARVGGPNDPVVEEVGANFMVRLESGHIVGDNLWLWRADHGVAGLVRGGANPCQTGLVVNGDDVTIYGLAVEHTLGDLVQWSGNRGRTFFYQSELPYDVTQAYGDAGYVGYRVNDSVAPCLRGRCVPLLPRLRRRRGEGHRCPSLARELVPVAVVRVPDGAWPGLTCAERQRRGNTGGEAGRVVLRVGPRCPRRPDRRQSAERCASRAAECDQERTRVLGGARAEAGALVGGRWRWKEWCCALAHDQPEERNRRSRNI